MADRLATIVLALAGALTGLSIGGCSPDPGLGWSTAPIHEADVRTVAVPIFANDTFDPAVHLELTDAVIKRIESSTPYRVVPEARADTILSGRIRAVRLEELSRSRQTGLSEEMAFEVTLDFEWSRLDTGAVLTARQSFSGAAIFIPSRPTGERMELGRFDAVDRLARDIVDTMQAAW